MSPELIVAEQLAEWFYNELAKESSMYEVDFSVDSGIVWSDLADENIDKHILFTVCLRFIQDAQPPDDDLRYTDGSGNDYPVFQGGQEEV